MQHSSAALSDLHFEGEPHLLAGAAGDRDSRSTWWNDSDRAIAELFGGETGDQIDKFKQTSWRYVEGVPVLEASQRWFIGSVIERIDFGDHVGHLLEPIKVQHGQPAGQLTHQQARDIQPGQTAPEKAQPEWSYGVCMRCRTGKAVTSSHIVGCAIDVSCQRGSRS